MYMYIVYFIRIMYIVRAVHCVFVYCVVPCIVCLCIIWTAPSASHALPPPVTTPPTFLLPFPFLGFLSSGMFDIGNLNVLRVYDASSESGALKQVST